MRARRHRHVIHPVLGGSQIGFYWPYVATKTAKARWDALNEEPGHPDNPNDNTPKGVARPEPDSMLGEDADSNTNTKGVPEFKKKTRGRFFSEWALDVD